MTRRSPDERRRLDRDVRDLRDGTSSTDDFDRLVVANGVFCEPAVPSYPGREEFEAAGGPADRGHRAARRRGRARQARRWSSATASRPVTSRCRSARSPPAPTSSPASCCGRCPRKIAGVVNFKFLLLTRMGEALFRYRTCGAWRSSCTARATASGGNMLNSRRLGLGPAVQARGSSGSCRRDDGGHRPRRHRAGHRGLLRGRRRRPDRRPPRPHHRPPARAGRRAVRPNSSDGTVLPADLVVCATGFIAGRAVPRATTCRSRLLDERAQLHALPADPADRRPAACTSPATTRRSSAR